MIESLGMLVLARGGRLIRGLMEGDPFAWTCLGVGVVVVVGISIVKNRKKGGEGQEQA